MKMAYFLFYPPKILPIFIVLFALKNEECCIIMYRRYLVIRRKFTRKMQFISKTFQFCMKNEIHFIFSLHFLV